MKPIVPGDTPFLVVYCQICELPVERMAIIGGRERHDRIVISEPQSAFSVEVEAECCGRYQGRRIGLDEMMLAKTTNQKLFVVCRKGSFQGLGALRRADVIPINRKKKAS